MTVKRFGNCRHWQQRGENDPGVGRYLTGQITGTLRSARLNVFKAARLSSRARAMPAR